MFVTEYNKRVSETQASYEFSIRGDIGDGMWIPWMARRIPFLTLADVDTGTGTYTLYFLMIKYSLKIKTSVLAFSQFYSGV